MFESASIGVNQGKKIEKWCQTFDGCAARKKPKKRTQERLHRHNVGASFERIALDILGSLFDFDRQQVHLCFN